MYVNESVTSDNGKLKVTLTAFDPKKQKGYINIEELSEDRGRYHVTVKFSGGDGKGQCGFDYKTFDVNKVSRNRITTSLPNDVVGSIDIVFLGTD